jgi:hypothetical protein
MWEARISFFISNDPHKVGVSCAQKSRESYERNDVFPEPVGPVSTVSSPLRKPLIVELKNSNRRDGTP